MRVSLPQLSLSHISHKLFSLLFIKNSIDTKKCNSQQRLFVTYLYVYVYNTISGDNNSKFLKSPNHACLVRVWEWHGIDTDCPVLLDIKKILSSHFVL